MNAVKIIRNTHTEIMCAPERMSTVKIIVDSPRSYHDEILTVVFFLYVYADSSKWPALEYHLGTIFLMIARRPNVLHPVNMHTCVLHDQVVAQMNSWFHEFDQGLTRLCWPIWCKMAWCRGTLSSESVTWHSFQCCCLHRMWHWTCRHRWRWRSGGAQHTQRRAVSFGVCEITHIKKQNKKHPNLARVKFSIPLPIALDAIADRKRFTRFWTTPGHLLLLGHGTNHFCRSQIWFILARNCCALKRINTTRVCKFGFYFFIILNTNKTCKMLECDYY